MKNIFFTGSKGFLGSHLVASIKSCFPDYFIYEFTGEIEKYDSIENEFKTRKWDIIIHFAGLSHVVDCQNSPQKAFEVNTLGTILLCQLMQQYNFTGRMYFTSTAQVFSAIENTDIIEYSEHSQIKPQNIYASTKLFSEVILKSFSETSECQISILRLFNHTHKSQSRKFFLPSVYNQILEAKDGSSIKVGNLNLDRDFSLIRDFLDFFNQHLLTKNTSKFELINLSSGVPRRLHTLVELLIKKSGKNIKIEVDNSLIRKIDPTRIVGNFKTSYKNKLTDDKFIELFIRD